MVAACPLWLWPVVSSARNHICFNCGKTHRVQTVPFLSIQFRGIKYIHGVVQPSPPCVSRTFSPPQTDTLSSLNTHIPFPPLHCHQLCLYESDSSGTSCEWNHASCVFLCLAYFTWHNVLQVRLCYDIHQNFRISFCLRLNTIPLIHSFDHGDWVTSAFWLL